MDVIIRRGEKDLICVWRKWFYQALRLVEVQNGYSLRYKWGKDIELLEMDIEDKKIKELIILFPSSSPFL